MGYRIELSKLGKVETVKFDLDDLLYDVSEMTIFSYYFELKKKKGRPRRIYHPEYFESQLKDSYSRRTKYNYQIKELDELFNFTGMTRKEICGNYYGKSYIDKEDFYVLYYEAKSRRIPQPYGDRY